MSDEEDYMSDAVLAKCDDHRPGLVFSKVTAKRYEAENARREQNVRNRVKPTKELEKEKRNEGLNQAIGSSNKGFALMAKMGYKAGEAIGKKGQGRTEPVPIELKDGRGGLGRSTELKRQRDEVTRMRLDLARKRMKQMENQRTDFRSQKADQARAQLAERDLYNSQKVCHQLDAQNEKTAPDQKFFWPEASLPVKKPGQRTQHVEPLDHVSDDYVGELEDLDDVTDDDEEASDESDGLSGMEKLNQLTTYLRHQYFYCLWCGTSYNDNEDLLAHCPGRTRSCHDD